MNILYFIGNGFDIKLKLKTKFIEFLEHYKTIESDIPLINKFKKKISNDIEYWSYLELALGDFSKNIENLDDFMKIFDDIVLELSNYISNIDKNFNKDVVNKSELIQDFAFPELSLAEIDKKSVNSFKEKWNNTQWNLNIITLNYTKILEQIFEDKYKGIEISRHGGSNVILKDILHVHGYYDSRMVLGVNDISQVSNKNFVEILEFREALVKDFCNQTMKHDVQNECRNLINNANLICIFGSSLGETDKLWWELIGERLKGEKSILVIFYYSNEKNNLQLYKNARIERRVKKEFLNLTKLTDEEKEEIENKIIVSLSEKMFNILIN